MTTSPNTDADLTINEKISFRPRLTVSFDFLPRRFIDNFFCLAANVNWPRHAHIHAMETFQYSASAEVFTIARHTRRKEPMIYRRFPSAGEAIRYAIEDLPLNELEGTTIETEEMRLEVADIRVLYERQDYPLSRRRPTSGSAAVVAGRTAAARA